VEDLSDNDDAILDADYQPPPQERSSSGDEDPQPTEHLRGRKRLRCENNGLPRRSGYFFILGLIEGNTYIDRAPSNVCSKMLIYNTY